MKPFSQHTPSISFDYIVKRQRRKTMALHIMPDATVEVRVPKWVPKREWIKFVEQKAHWVIRQQREALQKLALEPEFAQGQCHPYLGGKYPLNIHHAMKSSVVFCDNTLHVYIRNPNKPESIEKVLDQWYRSQAQTLFEQRLQRCYSLFPQWFQQQYTVTALALRRMRRRWGSCSRKGEITLNIHLIKMPLTCIDYVIVHELCHLSVFNHSPAFYQLMTLVMPDWKRRKEQLE